MNKVPIYTDFNSRDEDGGVWLSNLLILEDMKKNKIELKEGNLIWLTDGEVEIIGRLKYRVDRWVAIPDERGFKLINPDK